MANLRLKYRKKIVGTGESLSCERGFHSIQVDAGYFPNGFVAIWCVIRDHDRKVVLATSKRIVSSVESLVEETLAIKWRI